MTLASDIQQFREDFLPTLPDGVASGLADGVKKMVVSHAGEHALKPGHVMPSFTLSSATGGIVSSNDLLKTGPLVVSFYRGGWCPYCNLELRALQSILPDIETQRGTLVAISPQLPDGSLSTQEKNKLNFPVLSDTDNIVAQSFGLVIGVPDSIVKLASDMWELDVAKVNGSNQHVLPVPATYVVGQDGVVKFAFVNPDYTKRAEPTEILAALGNMSVAASN